MIVVLAVSVFSTVWLLAPDRHGPPRLTPEGVAALAISVTAGVLAGLRLAGVL